MTAFYILMPVTLLLVSMLLCILAVKRGKSPKKSLVAHLISFVVIMALTIALPLSASAMSSSDNESTAPAPTSATDAAASSMGLGMLAAALVTGLSGIGGGIAVAASAPAAIGATSEDPKNFGKSLIFVALGEGIALYGLLISILIYSKY